MVHLVYLFLSNHSAVSKPHPTEGAERYVICGIPGCFKVCCAMCTPLSDSSGAACLCCSLLLCCCEVSCFNDHAIFVRSTQNAYEHIHLPSIYLMYRIGPCVTCNLPRKNLGGERFAVLWTHTVQLSSPSRNKYPGGGSLAVLSRSMCGVSFSTIWHWL